jgi:GTP-sensing pleiotropic transcriptional regulator CodY
MVRKFQVVRTADPALVFDDLDTLQQVASSPRSKRMRTAETFARIPHNRAVVMRDIGGIGWLLLVEIDRLILKARGRNPVRLTNHCIRELGISRQSKQYYLRQLESAGVIKVQSEARKGTLVTHLWFPEQR